MPALYRANPNQTATGKKECLAVHHSGLSENFDITCEFVFSFPTGDIVKAPFATDILLQLLIPFFHIHFVSTN